MTDYFLEINELGLPIAIDGAERFPKEMGLKENSQTGKALRVIKKRVNDFEIQTTHLTPLQADMFFNLIKGRGHFYTFSNDMWSSKGLSPSATPSDWDIVDGHHDQGLEIESGEARFLLPIEGDWSVSFWLIENADTHYLVDSEDNVLVDGSFGSLPSDIYVDGNELVVADSTISDLIILESLVTDRFVDTRIDSSFQFSRLPRLSLTGQAFDGINKYEGDVTETTMEAFSRNGTFYPDGRVLSVEFKEI